MNGKGIITRIDGLRARVAVTSSAECAGCASKGHCGMGEQKPHEITVINSRGADVHDVVEFEAKTGKVILSAALIWILPVVSMIVGYFVAERFATGVFPIISAFAFLVMSYFALNVMDKIVTGGTSFYPEISKIITNDMPAVHCDNH